MWRTPRREGPHIHTGARERDHKPCFSIMSNMSLSTMARILNNIVVMKPLYKVPFERNSDRVKVLRRESGGTLCSQTVVLCTAHITFLLYI